ncbi:hypothetical protein MVEN_00984800 [Mycena venus]|uniref:Uncharacterized protein n=1 Tax=Mycena venus TaxID=2733690 RepID=A0A8H6YB58_9AGAR|nr:hypothetical protein MVEN_00984800 [Mycena venus]
MEDFKARIKELLGTDFTINIKAEEVWAYAQEGNTSAGTCFAGYVEGFISALKNFINKYEENGKTYFNNAVNPLGEKGETISSDVQEGVFRILFRHDRLGYNQSWLDESILPAVQSVPRDGFSLSAKHSIEHDYEGDIEELQQEINTICGTVFTLDPNFEENYKVLSGTKETFNNDNYWESRIGAVALSYFKGLKYQLERQGFKDDDMLQEGLQEGVESKTFRIRVVPETKKTTETVIEEGVVYLQCAPKRWGYNSNDMGEDLLNLL